MRTYLKFLACILLIVSAVLVQGCTEANLPDVPVTDPVEDTTAPEESTVPAETEPPIRNLAIVGEGKSSYAVIIPEGAEEWVNTASKTVVDAIEETTGVKLNWTDDFLDNSQKPGSYEILIGLTNRAESAAVWGELPYGEYVIRAVGDKLVIAAWDEASLLAACDALAAQIKNDASTGNWIVGPDYTLQDTGFKGLSDLPHYGEQDERVQFVDLGDNCYMLYAADTDLAEFKSYFTTLERAGYSQFALREMGDNLHAIYTNDKKIIHASYTAKDKDARISIEKAYDMSLFVESEYEKVCEPSVTMVGLERYGKDENGFYNQIGLCLIFQLEDGRFIVVDGGGHDSKMADVIYTALRKMAVDKKNITVAAWIFTHAHSDHTGSFVKFTNAGKNKTVKVQHFIHHFSTPEQYQGIDDGPDESRSQQVRDLLKSAYPGVPVIKAHTGQVIRAGGVEMEMIYTYEDLEPSHLEYHNTTSLVFRVTSHDNSIMVLGDASRRVSKYLVPAYGEYLRSDMVQVSHHGYTGGTEQLYEAIDADVVLIPTGIASIDGTKDSRLERSYNARAVELAEEVYIAGKSMFTFTFPYTPEVTGEPKIIK